MLSKRRFCPNCNKERMVSMNSSKGKQYRLEVEAELLGSGKPSPQELKKREEEFFAAKLQETQNSAQQTPAHTLHTKPDNDHW